MDCSKYLEGDGPSVVDHLETEEEGHGVCGHVVGDLAHGHHAAGRGIGGESQGLLIDHSLKKNINFTYFTQKMKSSVESQKGAITIQRYH